MSSYKLNIGIVKGCPPAKDLAERLEAVGDGGDRFAVLDVGATSTAVKFRLLRFTNQVVKKWDEEKRAIDQEIVRKVQELPVLILPDKETVEVQAGAIRVLEQIDLLLTDELGLSVVVEPIELDVLDLIERLRRHTSELQLVSGAVDLFSANSFTLGPYRPRFEDTANGLEFLEKYAEAVKSARVRFKGKTGRVTVTLAPVSSFSVSCPEEEWERTLAILRQVVRE